MTMNFCCCIPILLGKQDLVQSDERYLSNFESYRIGMKVSLLHKANFVSSLSIPQRDSSNVLDDQKAIQSYCFSYVFTRRVNLY